MTIRKALKVRHPCPIPFPLHHHSLFPLADRYAATILVETVTNQEGAGETTNEALSALMRQSRYDKPALEQLGSGGRGDLMNACYDAGLLLGLAFGLRLRGTA